MTRCSRRHGYYLRMGRWFGWRASRAERNRGLVLENWGAFVLEPADCATTRLIVRTRSSVRDEPLGLMDRTRAFHPGAQNAPDHSVTARSLPG